MELKSWFISFLFSLLSIPFGCDAAPQTYKIYKARGFSNTAGVISTGVSRTMTSHSACAMYCNYVSVSSSCFAAQYDTATQLCVIMQSSCKLTNLVACSTCTTYVLPSYLNLNGGSNLLLPLSTGSCMSYTDYLSTDKNMSVVTSASVPSTAGYSSGFMATYTFFTNNPASNPVPFYYTVQATGSVSPLNVFNNSFTVSFIAYTSSYSGNSVSDEPILEFLGPNVNQICYAWRYTGSQSVITIAYVTGCYLGYGYRTYSVSVPTGLHYTAVYNSNAQTLTTYVNGAFSSVNTVAIPPPAAQITRLKIGGTETAYWYSSNNGFYGSIGCINIFDRALGDKEASNLYSFCTNSNPQIIAY